MQQRSVAGFSVAPMRSDHYAYGHALVPVDRNDDAGFRFFQDLDRLKERCIRRQCPKTHTDRRIGQDILDRVVIQVDKAIEFKRLERKVI